MHSDHKRSHLENRGRVCLICGEKAIHLIKGKLIDAVHQHVLPSFNEANDTHLPCGVCSTHRRILYDYMAGNMDRKLNIQDFASYSSDDIVTRSAICADNCPICNKARATLPNIPARVGPYGRGRPNDTSSPSASPSAPIGREKQSTPSPVSGFGHGFGRGSPLSFPSSSPSANTMCRMCFSPYGPGLPHVCNRRTLVHNVANHLHPEIKEQVCSVLIKELTDTGPDGDKPSKLKTLGTPLQVSTGACGGGTEKRRLSSNDFSELQMCQNMSTNQIKATSAMVRDKIGRQHVQPNIRKDMFERSKLLESHFEQTEISLFKKINKAGDLVNIERPVIIVKDIKSLLLYVTQYRQYDPSKILIKLGLDGGQGFFKVTLNVVNLDDDSTTSPLDCQDTGVKKLIILCIIPDITELYENARLIFQKLELATLLKFVVATDLKLANVIIGIQSHGAQHPCCYCESTSGSWEAARHRTLGSVRNNYLAWYKTGSKPTQSKLYKNCVHLPLLNGPDDTRIIDLIPPPELHLLMGPFNHMYTNMKIIWPEVDTWAMRFHVKEVGYHGGGFIGGDCSKLLKNVDTLEQMCPLSIFPYVKALRRFHEVIKACFSKDLSPTLDYEMANFQKAYEELEISITPKLHILFVHVPEYCKSKECGLSIYSEQASESVHSVFRICWARRKINLMSNPNYSTALLNSVVEFNSNHL